MTYLVWEMTLAAHSTDSAGTKAAFLGFLEEKSEEMFQIEEKLFETRKEIADLFHKNYSELYEQQWYPFVKEISTFQTNLNSALMRLFLLLDVLFQIDETHPKRDAIETALRLGLESLRKADKLTDKITTETKEQFQAVHDAIVITRSIEDNISFEAADEIERKRWE